MVVASVQRVTPAPVRTAVTRNASRATSTVSSRTTSVPSSTGVWNASSASRTMVTGRVRRALASRRGRKSSYIAARPSLESRSRAGRATPGSAWGGSRRSCAGSECAASPGARSPGRAPCARAAGRGRGAGTLGGGVDPIFDCRGAEDLERPGQVVGQALDDDGVTTKREVGAVLLARSHRYEEAGIALKNEAHLVGDEGLEVQRRAHVALAGCAAAIAAAEWLHGSAAAWAWAAGAAGVAATLFALVRMPSPRRRPSLRHVAPAAVALACLIVGATLVRGVLQVQRIECCWPEVRAGRLPRDSSALKGTLAAAVAEARRLAERGMTAALLPRQAAFERVRDAVRSGSRTPGVERGVVILAPNGEAVAWAGRHRFVH